MNRVTQLAAVPAGFVRANHPVAGIGRVWYSTDLDKLDLVILEQGGCLLGIDTSGLLPATLDDQVSLALAILAGQIV
jgi:hypothetical protein